MMRCLLISSAFVLILLVAYSECSSESSASQWDAKSLQKAIKYGKTFLTNLKQRGARFMGYDDDDDDSELLLALLALAAILLPLLLLGGAALLAAALFAGTAGTTGLTTGLTGLTGTLTGTIPTITANTFNPTGRRKRHAGIGFQSKLMENVISLLKKLE